MSTTFEIKIIGIRAANINDLVNVIRQVDFVVKGNKDGHTFEFPQSVELGDPDTQNFIELDRLGEADVIGFVESAFTNMDNVKAHIQYVLEKEVAKYTLIETGLPWVIKAPVEPTV